MQPAAARAELEGTPGPTPITDAEIYAMIDSLGDVDAALRDAEPGCLERLYRELSLGLRYERGAARAPAVLSELVVGW